MSFYPLWFKQTVNGGSNGPLQADLTPAQVTVCSIEDKFVYNLEYKPISEETKAPARRVRENTVASSSSSSSFCSSSSSSSANTFSAANVVAARFQGHARNHTRTHTRKGSSESQALSTISTISEDSMWEDWIVKYLNEDKKTVVVDDAPMEDWIFETM